MTADEYEREYERLFKWRDRWTQLSNRRDRKRPRLQSTQERIERRAQLANQAIGRLLVEHSRELLERTKDEAPITDETLDAMEKAACAELFLELVRCPGGRLVVARASFCPHCLIASRPSSSLSVCDNPRPKVSEELGRRRAAASEEV